MSFSGQLAVTQSENESKVEQGYFEIGLMLRNQLPLLLVKKKAFVSGK